LREGRNGMMSWCHFGHGI